MKTIYKTKLLLWVFLSLMYGCSKSNDVQGNPQKNYKTVTVNVVLPGNFTADISGSSLVSLGTNDNLSPKNDGKLPFNDGSIELAYLLDKNNNVMLVGFLTDDRKEISVETTTEVMLYYALDYYLLPNNAKKMFLSNVKNVPGFSELVKTISDLFVQDPLMYANGTYLQIINSKINEIATNRFSRDLKGRILVNGKKNKSGITLSNIDSTHIKLQNAYPRRAKIFVYKKLYYDRNTNLVEIPNYTDNPIAKIDFKPVANIEIKELNIGQTISQINAQASSIENISTTDPIELPVNKSSELAAEYEVVVIGPGAPQSIDRSLTQAEKKAYEDVNIETYALDYLLPTLLDIGGNKALLPPLGDEKENALLNEVIPVLEANQEALDAVKQNDFKTASEILLPKLYGDIRLSDQLRTLLTNVYNTLSNNGTMPNTFVQSQELIDTGASRTQKVMDAMYKNMNFGNKVTIKMLNTPAKSVESWIVDSIDAIVKMIPENAEVCLGNSQLLRVSFITFSDPAEVFEYHWSTDAKFGGRIQDINNDPNNYGKSIVTTSKEVSYISTATASELSSGDNIETVTVTIFVKNKNTGELSEVGHGNAILNNKKGCSSFFVSFTKEVKITASNSLLCSSQGGVQYSVGMKSYIAEFKAVDGAKSYKGKIKRKDGSFGNEFTIDSRSLQDLGNGMLKYTLHVGSLNGYITCDENQANQEKQKRLDDLDQVGHQGIEITPFF